MKKNKISLLDETEIDFDTIETAFTICGQSGRVVINIKPGISTLIIKPYHAIHLSNMFIENAEIASGGRLVRARSIALLKSRLYQILELRKDKRFRKGLLQGAVCFDIIDQKEWRQLYKKYVCPKNKGDK